ncbi:MAG: hypothetical protein ACOYJJ_03810 [Anaerovoracaceae bacterium]
MFETTVTMKTILICGVLALGVVFLINRISQMREKKKIVPPSGSESNLSLLLGKVINDPIIIQTPATPALMIRIAVAYDEEGGSDEIPVLIPTTDAQEMARKIKKGTLLSVRGQLVTGLNPDIMTTNYTVFAENASFLR